MRFRIFPQITRRQALVGLTAVPAIACGTAPAIAAETITINVDALQAFIGDLRDPPPDTTTVAAARALDAAADRLVGLAGLKPAAGSGERGAS